LGGPVVLPSGASQPNAASNGNGGTIQGALAQGLIKNHESFQVPPLISQHYEQAEDPNSLQVQTAGSHRQISAVLKWTIIADAVVMALFIAFPIVIESMPRQFKRNAEDVDGHAKNISKRNSYSKGGYSKSNDDFDNAENQHNIRTVYKNMSHFIR
jgi:hypothetical protein